MPIISHMAFTCQVTGSPKKCPEASADEAKMAACRSCTSEMNGNVNRQISDITDLQSSKNDLKSFKPGS